MPARPCPICGKPAHPVGAEFVPKRRDIMAKETYLVLRKIGRERRNEAWHAVTDALEQMWMTGTGYLRLRP